MMPHLSEITIERFRGLRDLTLPGLGRVNVLVGANNSGKTSVLEAIELYCRPLDLERWFMVAMRREGRYVRRRNLEPLRWLFPQTTAISPGDYTGQVRISGQGRIPVRKIDAQYSEFFELRESPDEERPPLLPNVEKDKKLGAILQLRAVFQRAQLALFDKQSTEEKMAEFELWQGERVAFRRPPEEPLFPVEIVAPFSHLVETDPIRYLSKTALDGANQDIERLVNILRLMDDEIVGIDIFAPEGDLSSLYLQRKDTSFAPVSAFGDGVRRVLAMAPALASASGGVLLIDEVETSIHTSALKETFKWLVRACELSDIQLFATTHSLEAVDALLEAAGEEHSDLNVYRLERTPERTKSVYLDQPTLTILREELGQEVR